MNSVDDKGARILGIRWSGRWTKNFFACGGPQACGAMRRKRISAGGAREKGATFADKCKSCAHARTEAPTLGLGPLCRCSRELCTPYGMQVLHGYNVDAELLGCWAASSATVRGTAK